MASERQIAANRANAQKSTGPKTLAGRLKSSRNAYRHGLSNPMRLDPAMSAKADAIAHALASETSDEAQLAKAQDLAQAQLELLSIHRIRAQLMSEVNFEALDTQKLGRLASLDRYERYAHTRRRRASQKLWEVASTVKNMT
jgi:hypothetical protein